MIAMSLSAAAYACIVTFIILASCFPVSLDTNAWYDRVGMILFVASLPCSMAAVLVSVWNLAWRKRPVLHLGVLILSGLLLGGWLCM